MKLSMISSSFVLIAIAIGSIVQLVSTAVVAVEYDKSTCDPGPHNIPNPSIEGDIISVSPDLWYFQIPTTVINDGIDIDDDNDGMIIIEVNRTWAPIGADRFYSLVKDNYYNCAAFFRVVPNFIIQWGVASSSEESSKWSTQIQDDPVLSTISNTVGTVSFATAGPNTRTTQIFVNYADNSFLDIQGFVPFGKVIKGMDILTTAGGMYEPNPVPNQSRYRFEGNTWILQEYPDIDIIKGISSNSDGADSSPPKIVLTLNDTSSTAPTAAASDAMINENDDDSDINDNDDDDGLPSLNNDTSASFDIVINMNGDDSFNDTSSSGKTEIKVTFTTGDNPNSASTITSAAAAAAAVTMTMSKTTLYYSTGVTCMFFYIVILNTMY
jgi:peptidyl-prolyl cis-trans isomerase A (cyclophilin A)